VIAALESLDVSTGTWLAQRDPALAHLPEVIAAAGPHAVLHDVQWEPGRECRLAFSVAMSTSAATFVAFHADARGWAQYDFRSDPALPGLATITEPVAVSERWSSVVEEPILECSVRPVRYRPGSRCVLRYDLQTASGVASYYAKVFATSVFPDAARRATQIAAAATRVQVPPVVAVWSDLSTTVSGAIGGRSASAVLRDKTVPIDSRIDLAWRLGGLLADFHGLTVEVPRRTAADHVHGIAALLPAVQRADAVLADRLGRLLDGLARKLPRNDYQDVVSHGAFRPGQVILDGARLHLLDLDGVCRSDAARDLGNASSYLAWQAIREPSQRLEPGRLDDALLKGYQSRGRAIDPASLVWWRVVGMAQIAARRFRRLEIADWAFAAHLLDLAETTLIPSPIGRDKMTPTEQLEREQAADLLRRALAQRLPAASRLTVRSSQELSSAIDRRRVVSYTVDGLDPTGPSQLIAKTFTESRRAELLSTHLQALSDGPFATGRFRVPQLLAFLPDEKLVLYRACTGTPLNSLLRNGGPEGGSRDGLRNAAGWLAQLHLSSVQLPRSFDTTQEVASTSAWAAVVGQSDPGVLEPAQRLASRWATQGEASPAVTQVPIHKDFHAGHIVIGDSVGVIDLDEARQGDRAFDLAHFCAYLEFTGDTGAHREAFLEEYSRLTGWVDDGSFARYAAYTWLKIAKQLALGSGPCRNDRGGWAVGDAVRRGLACLAL
jgi:Ser/Thr protein kinase RdoA (MazF antagonist)